VSLIVEGSEDKDDEEDEDEDTDEREVESVDRVGEARDRSRKLLLRARMSDVTGDPSRYRSRSNEPITSGRYSYITIVT
jgi:hypothetical protein